MLRSSMNRAVAAAAAAVMFTVMAFAVAIGPADVYAAIGCIVRGSPAPNRLGTPVTASYKGPGGFTVAATFYRQNAAVTFANAARPVTRLGLIDAAGTKTNFPYKPAVTEDGEAKSIFGATVISIAQVEFCYILPVTPPPTAPPTAAPPPTAIPPTAAPTKKPTQTATPTKTPTASPTQTATPTPTATPIKPSTPTPTQAPNNTPAVTAAPTDTPLATPTTAPATPSPTPDETPVGPATPSPTSSAGSTPSPTAPPTASASPSPSASPTPEAVPSPASGGGVPPGTFPGSVPPFQSVANDPASLGISALLALLFLLLAAFPSQLFNKTLEENYAEVVGWFTRGGDAGVRVREALAGFWQRRSGLIVFVLISALLYGFLSPQFGPTIESFAALVGILGGLAIVIGAFELPLLLFQRRVNQDTGHLRVQPLTIFIGIACVVISRIADFQPGYLYGLVAAYAFARELPLRDEGRANAITAIWMLFVALGAWLLLPLSEDVLTSSPLLQMAIAAALATIFVGGLEALLFEMVPLKFLRGDSVFAWNRLAWGFLFVAAAFTFAHILLNPANGYLGSTRSSPLFAALVLFVGFGAISVAFWAYFRFRTPRPESEGARPGVP